MCQKFLTHHEVPPVTQTVSLSFFRFAGPLARVWALTMMGGARLPLGRTPDIGFWKLCGSGTGEGFTPVPNTAVYAILATWPDAETARDRTQSGVFARYQQWDERNRLGDVAHRFERFDGIVAGINYWPHPQVVLKFDAQWQDAAGPVDRELNGFNLGLGYQF